MYCTFRGLPYLCWCWTGPYLAFHCVYPSLIGLPQLPAYLQLRAPTIPKPLYPYLTTSPSRLSRLPSFLSTTTHSRPFIPPISNHSSRRRPRLSHHTGLVALQRIDQTGPRFQIQTSNSGFASLCACCVPLEGGYNCNGTESRLDTVALHHQPSIRLRIHSKQTHIIQFLPARPSSDRLSPGSA